MAREWRLTVALALTAALVLMGAVGSERASAEGIASGTTRIELYGELFRALKADGVRITKLGPAKVEHRVAKVPVSGGEVDVATGNGSIESAGGLRFRTGRRSVNLTGITLDTSKGTLRATLAGRKVTIAKVKSYDFTRFVWGGTVRTQGLHLTRGASALLNRKLNLDLFRPARHFALVSSHFQPADLQITGGSFQLNFDAGTVAKVHSLGLELVPLSSSAGQSDPPVFSSPSLLGGLIDPTMAKTWGYAEGGFRIIDPDSPGPSVDWWNLGFSFETGKLLSSGLAHTEFGQVAPAPPDPLVAVNLAGATVNVDPVGRTVTLSNAPMTLEAGVADCLNQTFAEPRGKGAIFAGGDPLGTVSMTLQGR